MKRVFRALVFVLTLAIVVPSIQILGPSVAVAQTEKKLASALKKAQAAYDNIELEKAEKLLRDGIALAEKEEMQGEVVGQLHIMLGILLFASTGEEGPTEDAFVAGLTADAAGDLPDVYRTPVLEDILNRARDKIPGDSNN